MQYAIPQNQAIHIVNNFTCISFFNNYQIYTCHQIIKLSHVHLIKQSQQIIKTSKEGGEEKKVQTKKLKVQNTVQVYKKGERHYNLKN